MKKTCFLIFSTLICAGAVAQSTVPDLGPNAMFFQQVPPPDSAASTALPNVVFRTPDFGGKATASYVAIADIGNPVTGDPYSATASTETTQVLADGNRIVNKITVLLARDSQGRTRREETMGNIAPLAVTGPEMAFISDPVAKLNYILDLSNSSAQGVKAGTLPPLPMPIAKASTMTSTAVAPPLNVQKGLFVGGGPAAGLEQPIEIVGAGSYSAEAKSESLGTQVIEGVAADGKCVTRTIPAGQIGNERPLEITYEVWTSPELQVVVLSKRNDPRFGETVYRLTDIRRGEPDHSLFEIPTSFTVKNTAH